MRFLIGLLLGAIAVVIEGLTLRALWGWHIQPLGAPALSLAHAVGLASAVGLITYQFQHPKEDEFGERVLWPFLLCGFMALIGWIAKLMGS